MSKRGLRGCVGFLVLVLSASLLVVSAQQPMVEQAPTAEQLEFFEGRVRPVLAEKYFQCHSSRTSTPFGGLRLGLDLLHHLLLLILQAVLDLRRCALQAGGTAKMMETVAVNILKKSKFTNFKLIYLGQFLELVGLPMHGAVLFYFEKPNLKV